MEKEKIKEIITDILKKKGEILFSYIHGSFLENDFRDIDIAVYLEDTKRFLKYELNLEREIEDVVGFPVDVRVLNQSPLSFRFNVIKNGILLFSNDENIRCDFESLGIVEYHDFDYQMKNYRKEAMGLEI
ncbi:MAG: nucleotidyltransferase domain-containing protein [Candidatus Methanoperedenaceae archaeon]|nr:nucleotidyltransferase domain-containing protein [Candidatus Methanoperedenaceae archaeon]